MESSLKETWITGDENDFRLNFALCNHFPILDAAAQFSVKIVWAL